ncbi:MAG: dihydropteroate synthase [Bdellovibrionales bacterium]|nr:dihydropteroate synthase [Bdellovibrionales bacterium]
MAHPLIASLGSVPLLMGIVNTTPDSFSDGGDCLTPTMAIARARELVAGGAHIVDIGGESTGPGSTTVPASIEWQRIEPAIAALTPETFISVDTYRASTANKALARGARMINDVSAMRADPEMASVVKDHDAYVVLMFSKETASHPHATRAAPSYSDVIAAIGDFLARRIDFSLAQGISTDRIVLDPGMGAFLSGDPEPSWTVLEQLSRLRERFSDFPLLVGTSRKSFLGGSVHERDPLSQLTGLIAALHGAAILRTHRVGMLQQFLSAWSRTNPGKSAAR